MYISCVYAPLTDTSVASVTTTIIIVVIVVAIMIGVYQGVPGQRRGPARRVVSSSGRAPRVHVRI